MISIRDSRMMREERVMQCRREFEQAQNESAAGQLLHRMSTVLSVAENTNFAAGRSVDAIGELFDSISSVQQGMVAQCEDLPFLYFARSFAVVMEEAVRQLQTTTTVPLGKPPDEQRSPHSAHSLALSDRLDNLRIGGSPTSTEGSWSSESLSNTYIAASAAPAAAPLVDHEAWRRALQRQRPHKILDFSPEAIEGRTTIYRVARGVREDEVRAILHPYGPLIEFYFGNSSGKFDSYALVKLESNLMADAAVARLHGRMLGGLAIIVNRAEYWSRLPGERPHPRPDPQPKRRFADARPQQPAAAPASKAVIPFIPDPSPKAVAAATVGCSKMVAADGASAADSVREKKEDSDAESDFSNNSFFSVD